jgi:hypothetical protein
MRIRLLTCSKQAFGVETGAQGNRLSDQGFGETDVSPPEADPTALLYLAHLVIGAVLDGGKEAGKRRELGT